MGTLVNYATIPYRHWQPRLARNEGAGAGLGETVSVLDDLVQAINTIVLTEKGSVPLQPEKCTRLMPYIDKRPQYAIPLVTREIFDAITLWEPRIIVERVAVTAEDWDHFRFPVFWRERADVTRDIKSTIVILPEERRPGVLTGSAA